MRLRESEKAMTTRYLSIAALLAVLLVLGAVGSGCGDSNSAEASLTKEQFVKRAEAICKRAEEEQLRKASNYLKENPQPQEEDFAQTAGLPPLEKEITQIKALKSPIGDETSIRAFGEEFESALEKVREDPKVILAEEATTFQKANKLAKAYGLDMCSSAP